MTDVSQARRDEVADKLLRLIWPLLVVMTLFGALAVVDLFTGFLMDDRLFDALLLAGCALAVWGFSEMRWIANRIRTNQVQSPLGGRRWFLMVTGLLFTLAFVAGMGYVIGGAWSAVALLGAVIAVTALGIVRGRRQRKRPEHAVL